MKYLTEDQIRDLKAIDTPTVANAVEKTISEPVKALMEPK